MLRKRAVSDRTCYTTGQAGSQRTMAQTRSLLTCTMLVEVSVGLRRWALGLT